MAATRLSATTVQGIKYADTVYKAGTLLKYLRGDMVTIGLRREGTKRTITKQGSRYGTAYKKGSTTTVTLQGSKYSRVVYDASGNPLDVTLYRGGSTVEYTLQGGSIGTVYYGGDEFEYYEQGDEFTDTVYYSGDQVTLQGDAVTADLFLPGTTYPNGLYTNLNLAELTTQDITALTV